MKRDITCWQFWVCVAAAMLLCHAAFAVEVDGDPVRWSLAAQAESEARYTFINVLPQAWKHMPIKYGFKGRATKDFKLAVRDALREWELESGGRVAFVLEKDWTKQDVTFWLDGSYYNGLDPNKTLAGTYVIPRWDDPTAILNAQIRVNGDAYKWHRGNPTYEPLQLSPTGFGQFANVSFDAVLTHEIGHALGLGHAQYATSLMYGRVRSLIVQDDLDGINALYPQSKN